MENHLNRDSPPNCICGGGQRHMWGFPLSALPLLVLSSVGAQHSVLIVTMVAAAPGLYIIGRNSYRLTIVLSKGVTAFNNKTMTKIWIHHQKFKKIVN